MTVLAVTRLSVRSVRFLPGFIWHAIRSERQARHAEGCLAIDVRREKLLVFWTRTAWRDEAAMRAYMTSGAHKKAMPKLQYWCNEASLAHWSDDVGQLPDWNLVKERLQRDGRVSRVRFPSHAQTQGVTVP